jgi:UDP-GlcNAc:undecaprenyl-phosphate GlcNAc-1-phosphate transferase
VDALHIVLQQGVSAGSAALMTPLVGRLAVALHVVDQPDARKVNKRPNIPLMGGLAIAVGCGVGVLVAGQQGYADADNLRRLGGFFLGGAVLLALGAYDDRFGLGARIKLAFQIAAAAVAFAYGYRLDFLTEPISRETYELPVWLAFFVTVAWVVAVTNAMNLMDGLDGLATGIGAIIALTLTIICFEANQPVGVLLGVVLVGAQLGFLPFNFPPGKIFLGDTGAYFVGYAIAVIGLEGYRKTALLTFVVPLMALAVPLLDTGLSVVRRFRNSKRIMGADRQHMHHRLLHVSGGSQRRAVLSLYFLTSCFCIIAVALRSVSGYYAAALLAAVGLLTLRLLSNLGVLAKLEEEAPVTDAGPGDDMTSSTGGGASVGGEGR